ncbi:MAG: LuxR C-terminal-related transcriptional regulator [Cyanobacteriota bacterium]|nr:LuxR C-terminal-related transcriptional regulator [Cyanobacteriota bacterium]
MSYDRDLETRREDLTQFGWIFLLQELGARVRALEGGKTLNSPASVVEIDPSDLEDPQIVQFLLRQYQEERRAKLESRVEKLSHREFQVLIFLAEGLKNREIAQKLNCKASTIKTHVERIANKFGVSNRAAIVATAFRLGLIV